MLKQLSNCIKQTEQLEREAKNLGIDAGATAQLSTLLRTAKAALAEAQQLLNADQNELPEEVTKLRLWERKLLDLNLNNNLLNMRLGRNAIQYNHDDIAALEDQLDMGQEFVLEQKELKGIYRAVRTNLEESGVNTLFLTLGTLCWNDCKGGRFHEAPILLVPVVIVPIKRGAYSIRKRDEDVMLNISLMEYLKQQFSIKIEGVNPLPQDTHGIDVSLVLHLVREAVKEQPEWSVKEDSVLGIFSFSRFVMWSDIHSHVNTVMQNPLIRSLTEGRLMLDVTESVDARQMDSTVHPDEMAIPVDADSSQLEAVSESVRGHSFILYGPPGTGKSQTITNLIANAMYHGKRVLFVAEKKAALDVVQSRLTKIGLAPFCLELHSTKMDKQHFLKHMQTAIDAVGAIAPNDYLSTANALYSQRLQLISYVEALHRPLSIGLSVYDCINRYLSLNVRPLKLSADFTKELTSESIDALCAKIKALDSGKSILGMDAKDHPLYGLIPKPKQPQKSTSVIIGDTLDKMLQQLPQIIDAISKQIERGKTIKFLNKTPRQYIEADFKWKKFAAMAAVDDALLDDIDALQAAATRWSAAIAELPAWSQYSELAYTLESAGLSDAVSLYYSSGMSTSDICQSFLAACYQQAAFDAIRKDPTLSLFNGIHFSLVIEKYKALTEEFQQLTRKELVARLSARIPANTRDPELSGELTLLRKRISSKGRGASIRAIIDQTPSLLPKLCPVMLMSPLSVAQYLDMDGPKFDIVVFDEASQMPTVDAVGAICRGKSIVIAGDPKQMSPTNFFTANVVDDDENDYDDMESILDDCISISMPSRYLGWHYRSKHESLIAFSNQNYYNGRLVTFPSVDDMVQHVTWQHVEGFYDYGKTRTNKAEAEAIVAETIRRMKTDPDRSVGIVAFSKQQSDLIEDIFNEQILKYPELDIRNRDADEPLFIKNLENVQGDERDVILFSVGYGPDKNEKLVMNFGPLNRVGGERRLNVAVSRARYEMKVFSTLRPEQIDRRRTKSDGVLGLKQFLLYAQQGVLVAKEISKSDESGNTDRLQPVIEQLAEALRQKGYVVNTDVGTSAFRVDVAVVDPSNEDRYLLGIICDGYNYYNLKTARDREVVIPSVLNSLGWNLMHVWSVDWLLRPDSIMELIYKQLKSVG